MTAAPALGPPHSKVGVGRWLLPLAVALGLMVIPLAIFAWLLTFPVRAADAALGFEHLVIVTNISFLALLVAVLVARSALEQKAYRLLFVALGFLSMAGFFAVHALATPGVLLPAPALTIVGGSYRQEHGADSVLGISAFLSLFIPALFFAARYLPLDWRPTPRVARRARITVLGLVALLIVYGIGGLRFPSTVARLPLLDPPWPYVVTALGIALFLFAAWRQSLEYHASRLPMQGAQVAAFLLLADAQFTLIIAPVWSWAWWEYHVLMLLAVISALWSLFIELDRRRGFERFVSPAVVDRVLAGDRLDLAGERRVVTILFGDLRGSTALADQLPAEAVVELLNSYVGAMASCVFDCGGILDKFLGDGLMAIFGVLPDASQGADGAVRTAQAIRRAIGQLNRERLERGQAEIGFGVGIHTGEVVLGAVGLPRRSDYTAIGDTVNTASRLESLCKEYHVDSVVSADAAQLVNPAVCALQPLGSAPIRGKAEPVDIFTIGR
ncbi:MAG TPA: adenylate/guanylate cyclase domain-containing protein [Chloroflexota bacterium]|nr:adenylate/guanylate cyclase domain-containing protein [Chloroflexota bacterium]